MASQHSGAVVYPLPPRNNVSRFGFFILLGLSAYYAYGSLTHWSKPAPSPEDPSLLQSKVEELKTEQGNSHGAASAAAIPLLALAVKGAVTDTLKNKANEAEKTTEAAASAVTTESSNLKTAGVAGENPDAQAINAPTYPYYPDQPFPPMPMAPKPKMADLPSSGITPGSTAEIPMVGNMSNVAPAATVGGTPVTHTTTTAASTSTGSTSKSMTLSAQDISWLTGGMKVNLADGLLVAATAENCTASDVPSMATTTACTPASSTSIPATRWGYDTGIEYHPGFLLRVPTSGATSGTPQIEAEFKFGIQVGNSLTQTETFVPTISQVTYSLDSATNKKTFVITFNPTTVRDGEVLTQLKATLVYAVSGTTGILSSESSITFVRASMNTLQATFAPNLAPVHFAGGGFVRATNVPYSLSVDHL